MEAKLVIVGGKANKRDVRLRLPTIVGRSRDADLTVAHPMVSRQHCQLFEVDGLLHLKDLGSLNGTFLAGEKIAAEVALRPGDEFSVGPLTFRAEYEFEPAAVPPLFGDLGETFETGGEEVPVFEPADEPEGGQPAPPPAEEEIVEAPLEPIAGEEDAGPADGDLQTQPWDEGTPPADALEPAVEVGTDEAHELEHGEPEHDTPAAGVEPASAEGRGAPPRPPSPSASGASAAEDWMAIAADPSTDPSSDEVPPAGPSNGETTGADGDSRQSAGGASNGPPQPAAPAADEAGSDLDEAEDAALKDFLKGLQ